ncbi:MAG: Yip1 family protein [Acidobacteriota bacterium]
MNLIDRVQEVLFKPKDTWIKIKEEQITISQLFTSYAVILAAIPAVATFIGSSLIGYSFLGLKYRVPVGSAFLIMIFSYIIGLIGVYIIGSIINLLAPSFSSIQNSLNAMKIAIFSFTPAWIGGIFNIIPQLSPIGLLIALYGLYLLYLGIPSLMETPKEKALGYTIVVILISIVVFVIVGIVVGAIGASFYSVKRFY